MRVLATLVLGLLGLWPSLATAPGRQIGAVVPLTGRYGAGGAQVPRGATTSPSSTSNASVA